MLCMWQYSWGDIVLVRVSFVVIIYHHQDQLREGWVYLVCSFRGITVHRGGTHGNKYQIWPQKQLSAHISHCKQETERANSKWYFFKFSKSTPMTYFLHQDHTSMSAQKGLPTGNKVSKCPKMWVTSHSMWICLHIPDREWMTDQSTATTNVKIDEPMNFTGVILIGT